MKRVKLNIVQKQWKPKKADENTSNNVNIISQKKMIIQVWITLRKIAIYKQNERLTDSNLC